MKPTQVKNQESFLDAEESGPEIPELVDLNRSETVGGLEEHPETKAELEKRERQKRIAQAWIVPSALAALGSGMTAIASFAPVVAPVSESLPIWSNLLTIPGFLLSFLALYWCESRANPVYQTYKSHNPRPEERLVKDHYELETGECPTHGFVKLFKYVIESGKQSGEIYYTKRELIEEVKYTQETTWEEFLDKSTSLRARAAHHNAEAQAKLDEIRTSLGTYQQG